ncbi:hypothetical protein BDW69DRAFT_165169 [Aspergillus filifer]
MDYPFPSLPYIPPSKARIQAPRSPDNLITMPSEPTPRPNSFRRRGRILPNPASGRIPSSLPPPGTITSASVVSKLHPARKGRYLPFMFHLLAAVPATVFLLRRRE